MHEFLFSPPKKNPPFYQVIVYKPQERTETALMPIRKRGRLISQDDAVSSVESTTTSLPAAELRYHEANGWFGGVMCSVLVGVVSTALYLRSASGSVSGGDSGELMSVAKEFGVAHPPGYPLWVGLSYGAESSGVGMHVVSPICGGISVAAVFLTVFTFTYSRGAGLAAAGSFAISPSVWRYSVTPEVFALNNAACAVLLCIGVRYIVLKRTRSFAMLLCSIVTPLALSNQHTSAILIAPSGVMLVGHYVFMASGFDTEKMVVLGLSAVAFCFVFGFVYSQLLWASYGNNSKHSWGAVFDSEGFWNHVLRKEYGTFSLANQKADYAKPDVAASVRNWVYFLSKNLDIPLVCTAFIGLTTPLTMKGHALLSTQSFFIINLVCYILFFAYLGNLPLDTALFRSVQERFWLQPYLLICLGVGAGYHGIASLITPKEGFMKNLIKTSLVALCIAYLVQTGMERFPEQDQSENYVVETFGDAMLKPLAKNSILLTKGDILTNSVRYVQTFRDYRRDVMNLDVEMLTSLWYIPRIKLFYPKINFPGASYSPKGFNARHFLEANSNRKIYVAYDLNPKDKSWEKGYDRVPVGMADLFVTKKQNEEFSKKFMQSILKSMAMTSEEMDHTLLAVNSEPWDEVCVNDYWASIFRMGHYLARKADEMSKQGKFRDRGDDVEHLRERATELFSHVLRNGVNGTKPYVRALSAKTMSTVMVARMMKLPDEEVEERTPLVNEASFAITVFIATAEQLPDKFGAAEIGQYREQLAAFKKALASGIPGGMPKGAKFK